MQSLPIPKPKVYKKKLKRHKDAVLALHSQLGFDGGILISGSSDHSIRIWDLMKQRIATKIIVQRPTDQYLMKNNYLKPKAAKQSKYPAGQTAKSVCSYCFHGELFFTGYQDGIICAWNLKNNGELANVLIGHEHRVNYIAASDGLKLFSAANDCTVRTWDVQTGFNIAVFKFSDPVSNIAISIANNMMYTASWDKMIRSIDLDHGKVTNSFQGATQAIKVLLINQDRIFVAGCDPVIRSWDLFTGDCVQYKGHVGWVYCMKVYKNLLFSGGDDKTIRIWNVQVRYKENLSIKCQNGKQMDQLIYHQNGVTCLEFALGDIFSGSYDHYIICWDLREIEKRIYERELMRQEDILSRKIEIYQRTIDARKGKKKNRKKKKGKKKK